MKELKTTHLIVNKETGEVVDELKLGDKVIKKENQEKVKDYFDEFDVDFQKEKRFIKMFDGMNDIRKHLNGNEALVLLGLLDFICYDDCIIRKGGHGNGKKLTIKELSDEMEINYNTFRGIITSLCKKGVLGIHKTGNKDTKILTKSIIVNPYILMRGNKINKTVLSLFEDTNWNNQ